jgi:ribosomal protein S18 acetylase RimI-like enzyme
MINAHTIEPIRHPACDADVGDLAALLLDAVDSGAAVSFLNTLTPDEAQSWWRKTLTTAHPKAIILVAREPQTSRIVGSVQLQPAWAPNQPDRADIAKLLVHRRARRQGIATRLMHEIESAARAAGLRLLTLDAKLGGPADLLYRSLGWTVVGTIPKFALDPDGKAWHDDILFYKTL